jgi:hypothetical protein
MKDDQDSEARRPTSVRDSLGAGGHLPTPVREAMDEPPGSYEPAETVTDRVITDGDHEWVVRVEGRATARAGSTTGTPLLLLTFAKVTAPDVRVHETVIVGRRLDRLSESELLDALSAAGRFKKDWDPKDLFKGTRRAK